MNSYPENWQEIAIGIKWRAGGRCVRCRHPHDVDGTIPCDQFCDDKYHFGDGKHRVLTVHHLDGDKSNCEWWNLPALCQICHLQIQAKVKMNQLWIGEHSEWFKPYLAGYELSIRNTDVYDRVE